MIVYGLTGSIGMGKSTAADMIKRMGIPVHDSDAEVHEVMRPGGLAFEEVAVTFPEAWDKKKHVIKRDVLADIVFNNDGEREKLEGILHPYVRAAQQAFVRKSQVMGQNKVVLDIPLLFETGADKRVDETIVVTAPDFMQRQRVLSRAGMNEELFEKILSKQISDGEKRARADYVVQTGLGLAHTYRTLHEILRP
ncbi:MAG: dephospho-CoA kinase [Pseudomonadota bacterium]